ncbi:hypothetical protein OIU76_016262 [Salix suchowensis]|uniref:BTB/POZ DOMAIN CONTAINING PROTEIN EXPRESSED-RELATED n=4 Tax=Salix TaxID=40685 RepID=A0A9Q0W1X4_9ROSI|nr:hypothetical protein OIU77_004503 [Salix suchowensis]KAJ6433767.1 hypothetical protein OIU84_017465 [Salix udensis]KAJ6757763.1 BTB/POZ DOMAIN CONTAINING PROTEIN EXPRESSED-RELATED [Salix koriyanagi]KAJ6763594.1 BTB/POZ DOMAIN CONTAINING PROTEIN EXPRESSED-RELATED [Salix purpurea]KAJ6379588.1 hypothetical protein OIU76_016262 [Salix suchowensis]
MDCSVCSSLPFILRPPRNTICGACYEGAKSVIALMNKLESDKTIDNKASNSLPSSPNPCKPQPLANIQRWMTGMKDRESELNEKISFLSGSIALLKDQILTDIQLKPGNDGPSISAHRALLAARSEIFRNLLDSDACKAPASDTIMLPELDHQELESLLEFLYSGSLPSEKLEKHVYSLTLAADKYDIPYLLKFCERHMLRFLNSSNALDVLEISDACSNKTLKETALNFIVKNMEDVVFSAKYEAFVPENPHLAVQITRALLMDAKNRRVSGV